MGQETPMHPLDPLTASEISAASEACSQHAKGTGVESLRFNVVTLQEPPKGKLLAYEHGDGEAPPRQAFCILQIPFEETVFEAVVELGAAEPSVISWKKVEGVHPLLTPDDCFDAEAIVKADENVRCLLEERYGVTDVDKVACDPWSVHLAPIDGHLVQTFIYLRSTADDNHYSHPTDMIAIVDLIKRAVVHIDKYDDVPKIPSLDVNYHHSLMDKGWRSDLKELQIIQPDGPSFTVEGNLVKWQKWQLRIGFNYREGLVLHDVAYEDAGSLRPVLHRASLCEMCVPYGDPRPPYTRKCAFDVGDYGLGYCANSLALGCDCLGHIKYFDSVLPDSKGAPVPIRNAVCLHEEDAGMLWKHVEYRNGHSEVRRSRRLVLSFVATIVNYEYAFYWSLYQDGTINFEIKLTGELSTNLLSPGEAEPGHGTMVAPGVNAQCHQHMFCARLDFAVDDGCGGKGLVVTECDVKAMEDGEDNLCANGFYLQETELSSELKAQRLIAPDRARFWKIKNPKSVHPVTGQPVAYKLMPSAAPVLMAQARSSIARRGAFATKNIWVTPYSDTEKWPAGDYPLQSKGGEGLPKWTQADRAVSREDPVVWHTFGVTHVTRPEDFPVMPVESVGFTLKPVGFFDGNPGIDIPPSKGTASKCCGENGVGGANGVA
eukprot:evm.model.scf_1177.3 EVM.evm.TU.scf_1177.3   scf_1177:31016-41785(+)